MLRRSDFGVPLSNDNSQAYIKGMRMEAGKPMLIFSGWKKILYQCINKVHHGIDFTPHLLHNKIGQRQLLLARFSQDKF